jgi:hypothetical protein
MFYHDLICVGYLQKDSVAARAGPKKDLYSSVQAAYSCGGEAANENQSIN